MRIKSNLTNRCILFSTCWSVSGMFWRPFRDVCSMSLHPFAWKLPNSVQWMPLKSRWLQLILRSYDHRSRSSCWSLKNRCPLNIYILTPLLENCQTRYNGCLLRVDQCSLLIQVTWSKFKVKLLSAVYSLSYQSSYESKSNYQLQTIEM